MDQNGFSLCLYCQPPMHQKTQTTEWVNLTQMTILPTSVGKSTLEEME